MSGLAIAALIFNMVETFGPKAKSVYDAWVSQFDGDPTPEQWAELKAKIESHDPDTY